jgi:nucleoside 2-deoxyribosyltransferase
MFPSVKPLSSNHLWKTKTYLVGKMHGPDTGWRDSITPHLQELGVVVFNPCGKPFIRDVQEAHDAREALLHRRATGEYEYLEKKMREIRSFDLNLVDRSDFIIAYLDPQDASWGSAEELVTAVRMKKPIFLIIKGGKSRCPLWIFGMMPHKYIYGSVEEVVEILNQIDSGAIELDSLRWKLLKKEYR